MLWTFLYVSLYGHILSFGSKYLGMKYLDHVVGVCLSFQETCELCRTNFYHFTFHATVCESSTSTSLLTRGVVSLFNFNYSDRCVAVSHCGFNNTLLRNDWWCWMSFHVLFCHLYIFGEVSVQICCHFKIWLFSYFWIWGIFLYSLNINFITYMPWKYLSTLF